MLCCVQYCVLRCCPFSVRVEFSPLGGSIEAFLVFYHISSDTRVEKFSDPKSVAMCTCYLQLSYPISSPLTISLSSGVKEHHRGNHCLMSSYPISSGLVAWSHLIRGGARGPHVSYLAGGVHEEDLLVCSLSDRN